MQLAFDQCRHVSIACQLSYLVFHLTEDVAPVEQTDENIKFSFLSLNCEQFFSFLWRWIRRMCSWKQFSEKSVKYEWWISTVASRLTDTRVNVCISCLLAVLASFSPRNDAHRCDLTCRSFMHMLATCKLRFNFATLNFFSARIRVRAFDGNCVLVV